ncbi:MAG: glutathione-disulfide reductase [Deltaproteobacteria bacterium]|nr:glutathione-disulfide reductase [Deltaproteobacteria bacterium]
MSDFDYDYFVIGAGSGGVRSSRIAASLGARVAICEDNRLGGTCVNVGCVPKKLLVYGSSYGPDMEDAAGFGWTIGERTFSWADLIAAKDKEIARLNTVYGRILRTAGVTVHEGRGVLIDKNTVDVAGTRYTAEHILITTGGRPWVPPIPGADLGITSDEVFDLPEQPKRAVIIGSGYIGVEFAGIFNSIGSETTMIYRSALPLRSFDEDVRSCLSEEMEKRGVHLLRDTRIECLERRADGAIDVVLGDQEVVTADMVLFATGRVPNTAGMGLEEAGVELGERGGIEADSFYATSVPGIWALGDVIDQVQLTPVALAEGMVLARRLFGGVRGRVQYEVLPTAVFSQPNVGTVGLTERDARARGSVRIYKSHFRPMKHTISGRDERTFMKIIVDDVSDVVLGVHMVGPDAGEIIQGFAVAMTCGATKAQFDATIGIHPTAAEELVTMRTPEPDPM